MSLIDVCTGNQMANLKKVKFYQSVSLKNIDCLKNSLNLENLSLTFVPASIKNLVLPNLLNLDILF